MGQPITDYVKFLAEARDAVYRLNCDKNTAAQLADQEEREERSLAAEKRALEDEVSQTVKKRLEEIHSSYDKEIAKGQERLRKARSRREKAKNKGMKERILEETAELREHRRELRLQLKTLFQKERLPGFCGSTLFYSLFYPRGLKECMILLAAVLICFLALPSGIYFLIPQRKLWQLIAVYFLDVVFFGGLYVLVGNRTRLKHQDTFRQGRAIRNVLRSDQKKIRVITHTIRRDGNEDIYGLEKYDDEIAQAEQELEEITSRKKDALNTFETVTKNIITDEIAATYQQRLKEISARLARVSEDLCTLERSIKEQNICITDTYGPYLGQEFLDPDKLSQLSRLIQDGTAGNITEAIGAYRRGDGE